MNSYRLLLRLDQRFESAQRLRADERAEGQSLGRDGEILFGFGGDDKEQCILRSTFVELTRHSDNLGFSSPSDYILVDDNVFIYDRTECEFSGIMTL